MRRSRDAALCALAIFLGALGCGPATQAALDREEAPLNTSELRDIGALLTLQPGLLGRASERETTMLLPATVGELTIAADAVVPGNGALRMSFENAHREVVPEVRLVEQREPANQFGAGCGAITRTFDCAALRNVGASLPQLCSILPGRVSLAYNPDDIEIAGTWSQRLVDNTTWGIEEIVAFDNARNLAVVRAQDGTFDTITWVEPSDFATMASCRIARGLPSQEEALAVSTIEIDTTSPDSTGCMGGAWNIVESAQSARLHHLVSVADDTKFELSVQLRPCQTMYVDLKPPQALQEEPVSFVVIGTLRDAAQFTAIVDEAEPLDALTGRRPGTHDFFVLLGDALENQSAESVGVLKSVIEAANVPTVVVLGSEEANELGTFTDVFGPFDFRWTFKGVQFINLYSADQQLREQGLLWIETSLLAMLDEDQAYRERQDISLPANQTRLWPAFAFTHTPPYDPDPVREKGFIDRLQASRVMSLLASYGVDTLFTGHLRVASTRSDTRPRLQVTTATGPNQLDATAGEYLTVTLTKTPQEDARAVGDRFIRVVASPAP